jgi:phosphoribosyl-ATP pyrophosphohydrolase/phosphoribosyl-AMP cyclohydrolase
MKLIENIDWNKVDGLVPAIIEDYATKQTLMLGYMNKDALEKTLFDKRVTFFSRTRKALWTKGETSGNFLNLVDIKMDCDRDTLLIAVKPVGPTCHKGSRSCFNEESMGIGFLGYLDDFIGERYREKPEGSYTTKLFEAGINRMAQKVGEEGVEVALASKDDDKEAFLGEAADLVYHLTVLLRAKGASMEDVARVLEDRHK